MTCALVFTALLALHAPPEADIVEQSDNAARIEVVALAPHACGDIDGALIHVQIVEPLWGDDAAGHGALTLWAANCACGFPVTAAAMIVGYLAPCEARRAHLGLPGGTLLLCGALPDAPGLGDALRALRSARSDADLLALMDGARQPHAAVRRQAFRQLAGPRLDRRAAALLPSLHARAVCEEDDELRAAYLHTFAHFRYRAAAPLAAAAILASAGDRETAGAEAVFHRLAGNDDVRRLREGFDGADARIQAGILRALAPLDREDVRATFLQALAGDDLVLEALKALDAAGRPLPTPLPAVRDPVRRLQMERFFDARRGRPEARRGMHSKEH